MCGGNNSSCSDCSGVPFGPKTYDGCGVCGGTNSTCSDCSGVVYGNKTYDVCGTCGGDQWVTCIISVKYYFNDPSVENTTNTFTDSGDPGTHSAEIDGDKKWTNGVVGNGTIIIF